MNLTMQVAVLVAVLLCVVEGAPDGRLVRSKQQRPTRGFKNVEMMTARGFGKRAQARSERAEDIPRTSFTPHTRAMFSRGYGKRSGNDEINEEEEEVRVTRGSFKPNSKVLIARGYGKRQDDNGEVYGQDNFWENLETIQERDAQDNEDNTLESIPLDWFVNEMRNNPDFTRSVVRKFIDLNQDGVLSAEELLRNVA